MGDSERQANANVMFDFITSSRGAKTADEVMSELGKAARHFGFSSFAVSGLPAPGERLDPYFLLNGWPDGWFERYVEQNYVHVDPVIQHTRASDDAFVWSEVLPVKLSRTARRVMNEASDFRMLDGFSVPIHGTAGMQAIVTYGAETVDLSPEARGALHIISIYAHNRLRAMFMENETKRPAVRITAHELEIIRWCAAGKTNWEIAEILGLSSRTIQHELANACRKLKVVNRAQLVAEAFRLGIIR